MQTSRLNNGVEIPILGFGVFQKLICPNVKEAWLTLFKLDIAILTLPLLTRMKRRLAGVSNKAALQEKNYLSLQNFGFREMAMRAQ